MAGCEAITVGVLPTTAVAHLTTHFGAAAGAVITASCNPPEGNGLKLFDQAGYKTVRLSTLTLRWSGEG
ncbi:hypothetical protein [Streptomyces cellostaticus]|uniref:hypothetical protein n=1 Tax=Streptomyces cellostaticus TaxID=67285 RepID=UPI0035A86FBC